MSKEDRDMLIETHSICKSMQSALFGNGKPGLVSDVVELQTRQSNQEEALKIHIADYKKAPQWPAVAAAIVVVTTFILDRVIP